MEQKIRQAYQALETTLSKFMPRAQRMVLTSQLQGEEGAGIADIVNRIAKTIADMPKTYETDGQGENAVAHLHYFRGSAQAWITEKDAGNPEQGDTAQTQAFGLVSLGQEEELGYVSIQELIEARVELDLYWTPKTIKEIRKGLA